MTTTKRTHSIETREKIRRKLLGRKPTDEERKKMRENAPRYWLGKTRPDVAKRWQEWRKTNSYPQCLDCKKKIDHGSKRCWNCRWQYFRGENHPQWRGGATYLNHLIRCLKRYNEWRTQVLKKGDYTCQSCQMRGGKLIADHIKPMALIVAENRVKNTKDALACDELWDLTNGRILCPKCHKKSSTYGWSTAWKVRQVMNQELIKQYVPSG